MKGGGSGLLIEEYRAPSSSFPAMSRHVGFPRVTHDPSNSGAESSLNFTIITSSPASAQSPPPLKADSPYGAHGSAGRSTGLDHAMPSQATSEFLHWPSG